MRVISAMTGNPPLNQAVFRTQNFENLAILYLSSFSYVLEQVSSVSLREKNWIISVTASQRYAVSATRWKVIVFKPWNRASPCQWPFWLVDFWAPGQSVNPSREAISILSGKYKRCTFVHPVLQVSLRLHGIMIGRHFHANIKMQTATCKDNNNSESRAATSVKFEINIKWY